MTKILYLSIRIILIFIGPIIKLYLKKRKIFIIYRFGKAIGDHICLTSIINYIYMHYDYKIIVITSYPVFFQHNNKIYKIINYTGLSKFKKSIYETILGNIKSDNITSFGFNIGKISLENFQKLSQSKLHLRELHSMHFDIDINFNQITSNEMYFSDNEIKIFSEKFKNLKNYALIQPIGKTTYTENKEWGYEKYQAVINSLQQINWIQIGLREDRLLENVLDFRDKTKLRELAWVIKNANFVLANEGMLNHLASAVNTKSYVVFSGFSFIQLALYPTTIAIYNAQEDLDCINCWLLEKCPKPSKLCTELISTSQVINTIKKNESI